MSLLYPRITVTGDPGCYQAWIHLDQWNSKRIGETFETYEAAHQAAEKALEEWKQA